MAALTSCQTMVLSLNLVGVTAQECCLLSALAGCQAMETC